jgi:hypothetical protein
MHEGAARIHYVRLYHFLSADHALDDVAQKRLKISQIDQLNDPFELWCVYQKDRRLRDALRAYKDQMGARFGVLCFSRHWHNPVLWSHYADRHRGICLGFDIDSRGAKPVAYQAERPRLRIPPSCSDADQLLYTKFLNWQYEEEWRSWIQIDERDQSTGLYFYNFDSSVRLREVIVGPLCNVPESKVKDALSAHRERISVVKARLAFKTFRVVRNLRGFRRSSWIRT